MTEVPIVVVRILRLLLQSEIALELLLLVLLGERLVAHPIDTRRSDIRGITASSVRFRHGGATGPWLSRFVSEVGLVVCMNLSIIKLLFELVDRQVSLVEFTLNRPCCLNILLAFSSHDIELLLGLLRLRNEHPVLLLKLLHVLHHQR